MVYSRKATEEDLEYSRKYSERSKYLSKLIKAVPQSNYVINVDLHRLEDHFARLGEDYGGLELNPTFQRGYVWTQDQKIHYMQSFARGLLGESARTLSFNCASFSNEHSHEDHPVYCLDGLQRYTAVTEFVRGEFKIFGELEYKDLLDSKYSMRRQSMLVQMFDFLTMKEMIEYYLQFNTGGTIHSDDEINRVKDLLKELD